MEEGSGAISEARSPGEGAENDDEEEEKEEEEEGDVGEDEGDE